MTRSAESPPFGTTYSVTVPDAVTRPIPYCFANQTVPSGPPLIPVGPVLVDAVWTRVNSVPIVVRLPTALGAVLSWVNQIFPSGPPAIHPGLLAVGIANSVIVIVGPFTSAPAPPVPVALVEPAMPAIIPAPAAPVSPPPESPEGPGSPPMPD